MSYQLKFSIRAIGSFNDYPLAFSLICAYPLK